VIAVRFSSWRPNFRKVEMDKALTALADIPLNRAHEVVIDILENRNPVVFVDSLERARQLANIANELGAAAEILHVDDEPRRAPDFPINSIGASLRVYELMLREYEVLRDDERSSHGIFAALLTVLVAVLGALAALFATRRTINLPDWTLIALPLAPIAILALLVPLARSAILRSWYLSTLERELFHIVGHPLIDGRLPLPASHHVSRRVWIGPAALALVTIAFIACASVFAALIYEVTRAIDREWLAALAAVIYGVLVTGLLTAAGEGYIRQQELWAASLRDAQHQFASSPSRAALLEDPTFWPD
jgi:hypothetical protein